MDDPLLQAALDGLALPGVTIGHRFISPGDENALLEQEARAFASSILKVRRASGAARIVAREIFARIGQPPCAIPNADSGAPIWPDGFVGSLAHDPLVAVAAVARQRDFAGIGIDIEPPEELPVDLVNLVATPTERLKIDAHPYGGRLLFAAKEAVYKAVYPLDQVFLDHHDVEVDFTRCKAAVRGGRIVEVRFCVSPRVLALAFIPAAP